MLITLVVLGLLFCALVLYISHFFGPLSNGHSASPRQSSAVPEEHHQQQQDVIDAPVNSNKTIHHTNNATKLGGNSTHIDSNKTPKI
jgi:hypothetical protein